MNFFKFLKKDINLKEKLLKKMDAVGNDSALRQHKEGILDYTENWSKVENKISLAFMWARYCWVTWQINLHSTFRNAKSVYGFLHASSHILKTYFHILYRPKKCHAFTRVFSDLSFIENFSHL